MCDTTNWHLIDLNGLVPSDVEKNSGRHILCTDRLTGDNNEIIVLIQLGRKIYDAYVCHLSAGCDCINGCSCKVINDLPSFPQIIIRSDLENLQVKTYNGIKITMVCLSSKQDKFCNANWLY